MNNSIKFKKKIILKKKGEKGKTKTAKSTDEIAKTLRHNN